MRNGKSLKKVRPLENRMAINVDIPAIIERRESVLYHRAAERLGQEHRVSEKLNQNRELLKARQ